MTKTVPWEQSSPLTFKIGDFQHLVSMESCSWRRHFRDHWKRACRVRACSVVGGDLLALRCDPTRHGLSRPFRWETLPHSPHCLGPLSQHLERRRFHRNDVVEIVLREWLWMPEPGYVATEFLKLYKVGGKMLDCAWGLRRNITSKWAGFSFALA